MNKTTAESGTKQRGGAAAVELAVVAPVLVLILMGIVEFGSVFYVRQTMVQAARSGARQLAIQGATEGEAIAIAENFLSTAAITGATVTAQNAYAGSGDDAAAREVWVQIQMPTQNALILGDALNLFPETSVITVRPTRVCRGSSPASSPSPTERKRPPRSRFGQFPFMREPFYVRPQVSSTLPTLPLCCRPPRTTAVDVRSGQHRGLTARGSLGIGGSCPGSAVPTVAVPSQRP